MHERVDRLADGVVTLDHDLEREFEARRVESSTLAFRVAYSVLRQREDAEDVAQEAFAKAYRAFRQLRHRDRFRAWLVRMAWRLALDRRRGERRREARERRAVEAQAESGMAADRKRADRVWEAIDALPEKLRVVTVLAAIHGHELREVALLLRLPVGTVKSRLFLARQRMKEFLQ